MHHSGVAIYKNRHFISEFTENIKNKDFLRTDVCFWKQILIPLFPDGRYKRKKSFDTNIIFLNPLQRNFLMQKKTTSSWVLTLNLMWSFYSSSPDQYRLSFKGKSYSLLIQLRQFRALIRRNQTV